MTAPLSPLNPLADGSWPLPAILAWLGALPAGLLIMALLVTMVLRRPAAVWAWAVAGSAAAGVATVLNLGVLAAGGAGVNPWLRLDLPGALVALLVGFIAWVILRFARTYLAHEPHEAAAARGLLATLAAVQLVVAANHLAVLAAAWTLSGWALYPLLTFFRDRPAALVAAHKQRLVGTIADVATWAAVLLLATGLGTWQIDQAVAVAAQLGDQPAGLPTGVALGVVLVSLAACLRCAQLPFHGWLIQVMEAPTPVSALLHAGVVNLGGFVLLRLAPLVTEVVAAQVLLVAVGTLTAVLAALVMATRISIKVQLAWSTCAQMGFMLMQCGLGAWEMALLHLLAHSLYKAHAFLAAGGAVRQATLRQLAPPSPAPSAVGLLASGMAGVWTTLAAGLVWTFAAVFFQGQAPTMAALAASAPSIAIWVLAGIVALALVPLLRPGAWGQRPGQALRLLGTAFAVALGYVTLHALFAGHVVPVKAGLGEAPVWLAAAVAVAFAGLFAAQVLITALPRSAAARRFYPWFYGGLFLDEAFTRVAFTVWPPRARARPLPGQRAPAAEPFTQT